MPKLVTLHISPDKLRDYEDLFPNVLQPTPISNQSANSSLLSNQPIKKIIIKKPSAASTAVSPSVAPTSGNATPVTNASETPVPGGGNSKGRSGLAASANGGLLDLDKSGVPCKKWIKRNRTFKTFTGYPISVKMFREDNRKPKVEKV